MILKFVATSRHLRRRAEDLTKRFLFTKRAASFAMLAGASNIRLRRGEARRILRPDEELDIQEEKPAPVSASRIPRLFCCFAQIARCFEVVSLLFCVGDSEMRIQFARGEIRACIEAWRSASWENKVMRASYDHISSLLLQINGMNFKWARDIVKKRRDYRLQAIFEEILRNERARLLHTILKVAAIACSVFFLTHRPLLLIALTLTLIAWIVRVNYSARKRAKECERWARNVSRYAYSLRREATHACGSQAYYASKLRKVALEEDYTDIVMLAVFSSDQDPLTRLFYNSPTQTKKLLMDVKAASIRSMLTRTLALAMTPQGSGNVKIATVTSSIVGICKKAAPVRRFEKLEELEDWIRKNFPSYIRDAALASILESEVVMMTGDACARSKGTGRATIKVSKGLTIGVVSEMHPWRAEETNLGLLVCSSDKTTHKILIIEQGRCCSVDALPSTEEATKGKTSCGKTFSMEGELTLCRVFPCSHHPNWLSEKRISLRDRKFLIDSSSVLVFDEARDIEGTLAGKRMSLWKESASSNLKLPIFFRWRCKPTCKRIGLLTGAALRSQLKDIDDEVENIGFASNIATARGYLEESGELYAVDDVCQLAEIFNRGEARSVIRKGGLSKRPIAGEMTKQKHREGARILNYASWRDMDEIIASCKEIKIIKHTNRDPWLIAQNSFMRALGLPPVGSTGRSMWSTKDLRRTGLGKCKDEFAGVGAFIREHISLAELPAEGRGSCFFSKEDGMGAMLRLDSMEMMAQDAMHYLMSQNLSVKRKGAGTTVLKLGSGRAFEFHGDTKIMHRTTESFDEQFESIKREDAWPKKIVGGLASTKEI